MKLTTRSPNCNVIEFDNGTSVLFSYSVPVAVAIGNPLKSVGSVGIYKSSAKYSNSTNRHINAWTATTKTLPQAELEALINTVIV